MWRSSKECKSESSNIPSSCSESMFPMTQWSCPTPWYEITPHTLTLPPLPFTVGVVFLGKNSSPTLLQQYFFPSEPKRLYFDSSENHTRHHKWRDHFANLRAQAFRLWTWIGLRRGFFLRTLPCSPNLLSALRMVEASQERSRFFQASTTSRTCPENSSRSIKRRIRSSRMDFRPRPGVT